MGFNDDLRLDLRRVFFRNLIFERSRNQDVALDRPELIVLERLRAREAAYAARLCDMREQRGSTLVAVQADEADIPKVEAILDRAKVPIGSWGSGARSSADSNSDG